MLNAVTEQTISYLQNGSLAAAKSYRQSVLQLDRYGPTFAAFTHNQPERKCCSHIYLQQFLHKIRHFDNNCKDAPWQLILADA